MQYNNIKFLNVNAEETGLESESCDVILCADLVEHLSRETFGKVLDECQRLLKKRGKLVIWTPNRGHIFEILKSHNIILKKDVTYRLQSNDISPERVKKKRFYN